MKFETFSPLDLLAMRRRGHRPANDVWAICGLYEGARIASMRSWAMGESGPYVVFTEFLTPLTGIHGLDVTLCPLSYSSVTNSEFIRDAMRAEPRTMKVLCRDEFEAMVAEIVDGLESLDDRTTPGQILLQDLKRSPLCPVTVRAAHG